MDKSVMVKIQYFHDAIMTQIDSLDSALIANYKMTSQENSRLHAKKSALQDILERYENLFEDVIYVEK